MRFVKAFQCIKLWQNKGLEMYFTVSYELDSASADKGTMPKKLVTIGLGKVHEELYKYTQFVN